KLFTANFPTPTLETTSKLFFLISLVAEFLIASSEIYLLTDMLLILLLKISELEIQGILPSQYDSTLVLGVTPPMILPISFKGFCIQSSLNSVNLNFGINFFMA